MYVAMVDYIWGKLGLAKIPLDRLQKECKHWDSCRKWYRLDELIRCSSTKVLDKKLKYEELVYLQ